MGALDDDISFNKAKILEVAATYNRANRNMSVSLEATKTALNTIGRNWTGPERSKAESDFKKAEAAINSLESNLHSMGSLLIETAEGFNKVNYD